MTKKKDKKKEKKTKKVAKTWEKVFVVMSFVVMFIILWIYALRTIYYYRKTNYIEENARLIDVAANQMKVVYSGDGLYKNDDNTYYYNGTIVDNYLYYSGMLWRIIGVDDIGIKIITEDNLTSLVWGINANYQESNIYKWLNEDTFINAIYNKDDLVSGNWCNESVDLNDYKCSDNTASMVGLLSVDEYLKSGGISSYLNNGSYFWTVNTSEDNKAYYIHNEGGINNEVSSGNSYYSYGVRPVIYLSKDIKYLSGTGTIDEPYIVETNDEVEINNHPVGSYVKYNDYTFRILEVNEENTLLILDGYLTNEEKEGIKVSYKNINSSLNEFISKFKEEELSKYKFAKTEFNFNKSYDYKSIMDSNESYVGIPTVGTLFTPEYDNVWLNTYSSTKENLIYTTAKNANLFANLGSSDNYIRPIICIKNGMIIASGSGTKTEPFMIGDKS